MLAALLELVPAGVEQVDGEGWVEYAVYGAPGELPAFPPGEAEVGGARVRVRGEPVSEDWAERWREFHRPAIVAPSAGDGPRLWVRPPWIEPRPDLLDLVIDPGQAFGTGSHPTTRLSLELLLGLDPRGTFADLGCGSGVLAIAAAKLGFGPVSAFDNDLAALEATLENAKRNGVRLNTVERLNLRESAPPPAETVAANLMRPLLLSVAELMAQPPLVLVISGLLEDEANEVAAAFAPLRERRRLVSLGWSAVVLTRP